MQTGGEQADKLRREFQVWLALTLIMLAVVAVMLIGTALQNAPHRHLSAVAVPQVEPQPILPHDERRGDAKLQQGLWNAVGEAVGLIGPWIVIFVALLWGWLHRGYQLWRATRINRPPTPHNR